MLTGHTNAEFGALPATENDRFSVTRSPWNLDRTPGGSSGGAAAAVESGMFAVAHGGDGGGSLRIPASYCGLVALEASRGRGPRSSSSDTTWSKPPSNYVLSGAGLDAHAALDS